MKTKQSRYELIIYWSKEDNAFVVEVPELPGCMADGKTYEEAVANAQEIIADGSKRRTNWGGPFRNPRVA